MGFLDTILNSNPVGAAVSGATSLIGGLVAGHQNRKMQRQTNALNYRIFQEGNQFNAQQAQLNRDFQLKTMQMQNEYNSPENQRRLLEQAGYNPLLGNDMAAMSASGLSGSEASSAGASPMEAPAFQNLGSDVVRSVNQQLMLQSELNGQHSDNMLKAMEVAKEQATFQAQIAEIVNRKDISEAQKENLWKLGRQMEMQMDVFTENNSLQQNLWREQTNALFQQSQATAVHSMVETALANSQLKLNQKTVEQMNANISYIVQNIQHLRTQDDYFNALTRGVTLQNDAREDLKRSLQMVFSPQMIKDLVDSPMKTLQTLFGLSVPSFIYNQYVK